MQVAPAFDDLIEYQQTAMSLGLGIVRTGAGLRHALAEIEVIRDRRKGRPCEVDHSRLGQRADSQCEAGKTHGLPGACGTVEDDRLILQPRRLEFRLDDLQ